MSDSAAGVMPLEDLQDAKICKPNGVDAHHREMHLADDEFLKLLSASKAEFQGLPRLKKDQAKKKHGLLRVRHVGRFVGISLEQQIRYMADGYSICPREAQLQILGNGGRPTRSPSLKPRLQS